MKRRSLSKLTIGVFLILLLAVIPLLPACTGGTPAPTATSAPAPTSGAATPAGPTVTLNFAFESSSGIRSYSVWPYRPGGIFEQLVTQTSKGRIKLVNRENLYGVSDTIFAAGDGRTDMTNQLVPTVNATYPLLDFGGLPGFFSGGTDAGYEYAAALSDPRMRAVLDQYTRPAGFVCLGGMAAESAYAFWGKKPINTVADFKGAKTRTGGLAQTLALQAVGGSPLTVNAQELADALTRGTVDYSLTNLNQGSLQGLEDICPYVSQWEAFGTQFARVVVINAKKYDSLPPDLQQALNEAGRLNTIGSGFVIEQIMRDIEANIAARKKTTIVYPSKDEVAKAAVLMEKPIQEWLKTMGPLAPQVVRIAADYAHGPSKDIVLRNIK